MSQTVDYKLKNNGHFAAVMLVILGAFNILDGIVLLNHAGWVDNRFLFSGATTWGWMILVFAVLQIMAGMAIGRGTGGKGLGILVAGIGMTIWFALLFVTPFASLIGVAINYAIIMNLMTVDTRG